MATGRSETEPVSAADPEAAAALPAPLMSWRKAVPRASAVTAAASFDKKRGRERREKKYERDEKKSEQEEEKKKKRKKKERKNSFFFLTSGPEPAGRRARESVDDILRFLCRLQKRNAKERRESVDFFSLKKKKQV